MFISLYNIIYFYTKKYKVYTSVNTIFNEMLGILFLLLLLLLLFLRGHETVLVFED